MLFKLNIYRLGEERRLQERNRTRALAVVVLLVGLNFVTMVLYGQALWDTSRGVTAANARLADAQEVLDQVIEEGGAISEEQIDLLRVRSAQPSWSALLGRVYPGFSEQNSTFRSEGFRPPGHRRSAASPHPPEQRGVS